MEARRQRVLDLLHAGMPIPKIVDIVHCSTSFVYKVKAIFKTKGTLQRKPGSGGHNKKRTEEFLTGLACEIEASPTTSIRKLAKELNVSRTTISKAVKNLGAYSYVRRRRQLLSEKTKQARVKKGKLLLWWLKKNRLDTVKIFSDKKLFTVDQSRNSRNDRYLAYHIEDVHPINQTKHPASVMVLGVVASDGSRMPPYFFPKGLKITTEVYLDVLKTVVKPWVESTFPNSKYVWQQDSAPAHKAKRTQQWCKKNFQDFWPWSKWPPSSPDLNPLDYGIWGYLESKACATPQRSVDDLKSAVIEQWTNMPESFVKKTCKAFRPRLEAMLKADGGHFEKM